MTFGVVCITSFGPSYSASTLATWGQRERDWETYKEPHEQKKAEEWKHDQLAHSLGDTEKQLLNDFYHLSGEKERNGTKNFLSVYMLHELLLLG